jgi:alkylhydroperoxidase family enzyme
MSSTIASSGEHVLTSLVISRSTGRAITNSNSDINSAVGRKVGVTDEQLQDLAIFETSPHFDRREKAVLRYAEGMTRTPLTFPTQRLKKYAPCSAPNKSSN